MEVLNNLVVEYDLKKKKEKVLKYFCLFMEPVKLCLLLFILYDM